MVISAVKANLRRAWTVAEMGAIVGVSDAHLRRMFARGIGRSPKDLLNDFRLQAAAQLLSDPSIRIKEIQAQVGILDGSHFCRHFRRRYGLSPKEFRSNALKEIVARKSA